MVTIDTTGSGAVMEGTEKWMRDTIKAGSRSWRWSRSLDAWYLPRSFRPETTDQHVKATVRALNDAGIAVEVMDGERDSDETRRDRRIERDHELASVHADRARRRNAQADALAREAHRMSEAIPFGQPMMPDHYSYGRDRRYRDRMRSKMGKAVAVEREAETFADKGTSASARAARAEWKRSGGRYQHGDIEVGDMISRREAEYTDEYNGAWRKVIRVSKKSVTVNSLGSAVDDKVFTSRVPYLEIHRVSKQPEDFELARWDLQSYRPKRQ